MKTAKQAHDILKKRLINPDSMTNIGWHNHLTDIVNHIYEHQQYATQQQPIDMEEFKSEINIVLEHFQTKYDWLPDGESKFVMNRKFVSAITAILTRLNQPQKSAKDCSTCKHREVSKYVEPCYGCRDNDGYDNYEPPHAKG